MEPLAARVLRARQQIHDQIGKLAEEEGNDHGDDHEGDARVQLDGGLLRQACDEGPGYAARDQTLPDRRLVRFGRSCCLVPCVSRIGINMSISNNGIVGVALGRGGRVLFGVVAEQALLATLGLDELLCYANVHDEQHGEGQPVHEYEVAVATHDKREQGRFSEAGHACLVVGLIERGALANRLDLEPAGQVVDKAEEEDERDGGEGVAERADLVRFEWPRHVDPSIDSDGARQVEREQLKRGEDGTPDAVDQAYVALVLIDDVGVLGRGRAENHDVAEHLIGKDVAQRVEENEVDEAHDVGERERGQIGVGGEGAHARMQQHEYGEAVEDDAEHAERKEQVAVDEETCVQHNHLLLGGQLDGRFRC